MRIARTGRGIEPDAVVADKRGGADGRFLMAFGLLVDAVAVAAMGAAIMFSSGGLLAVSLIVGNLLLIVGVLVAYRGRIRSDPD